MISKRKPVGLELGLTLFDIILVTWTVGLRDPQLFAKHTKL